MLPWTILRDPLAVRATASAPVFQMVLLRRTEPLQQLSVLTLGSQFRLPPFVLVAAPCAPRMVQAFQADPAMMALKGRSA
mmetsp:Transcript_7357/g.16089  ORF Transcript_7357/g.16089 Transcript_7357/m.16089 type:complete len:80 (-) Transcript_7357:4302-4541(-)